MKDNTYLMSIQPYFVLDANDFCQRVLLQNGISHFYSFSNSSDSDITVNLFVDGCSNIIFEYCKGANNCWSVRTHFIGSTIEPRTFCVRKNCEYFCIRLQPGASGFIKKIGIKGSVGKIIILDTLPFIKDFCLVMKEQKDFDSRIKVFLEFYDKIIHSESIKAREELFRQIVNIIIQRRGMIKVSELEKLSGYTSRYINLIFDSELGFSAKQFCSSVKFQFLLNDLNRGNSSSLTNLSSEYKFYDQAHFIHEFKNCTGKTPSEYVTEVYEKNYSNNIINI
ncbi:MAG: helix-turn-helix domain-containing protein [Treponema sp.]|nr:helix-turn-helix domain-containing protein [Treponema sp.]